jgi:hypothetical protein
MAITGAEGSFVFISFRYSEPIKSFADIKPCEVFGTFEAIKEFGNKGERITIFDSDVI